MIDLIEWRQSFNIEHELAKAEAQDEIISNPVSEGKHIAKILEAEAYLSTVKGTPGTRIKFACLDTNKTGGDIVRELTQTFWMNSDENLRKGFIPLIRACEESQGNLDDVLPKLIGKCIEINIRHSDDDYNKGDNDDVAPVRADIDVWSWGVFHGMRTIPVELQVQSNEKFASFGYTNEVPF